jgi:hypothetical protein
MARVCTLLLAFALGACSGTDKTASKPASGGTAWKPGIVLPSTHATLRGYIDVRGLIHAHSVYSHDACDNAPRDPDTGAINQTCFDDFRRGMCQSQHDFIMLSDHNDTFGDTPFPDVLLYRKALGDQLIERGGHPVANRAACPDGGHPVMLLAGTESNTMPVGLEGHLPGSVDARKAVYGDLSADAINQFKADGAVALVAHTENWTLQQLTDLPLDGFEMYNLHANAIRGAGGALSLITKIKRPDELPQSDLVLLPIWNEDPRYIQTWGSVLASGAHRVTTMATDCHQNAFPQILPDGERIDSYRRMMEWFSNHLLVRPKPDGSWNDQDLKDALRAGRLYGAFEVMGYPVGFDFHAVEGKTVREMGEEASLANGVELDVVKPQVADLDPAVDPPRITLRLLRARSGGWDEIAKGERDLAVKVTEPGAYRAEVRILPHHLRGYLSSYADLADQDFVWIYSNPVYVVD